MVTRQRKTSDSAKSIQDNLAPTRISLALLDEFEKSRKRQKSLKKDTNAEINRFKVIIDFNRSFPGGAAAARITLLRAYGKARPDLNEATDERLRSFLAVSPQSGIDDSEMGAIFDQEDELNIANSLWTDSFVFGQLSKETIDKLSEWSKPVPLIYKIWLDHALERCVYDSRRTVKCDAALASFAADGKNVVWAVADTGIDGGHPHFISLNTLELPDGLRHWDFTETHSSEDEYENAALKDTDGHGTHVAGIIAGRTCPSANKKGPVGKIVIRQERQGDQGGTKVEEVVRLESISGLAPYCRLLSLRVLQKGTSVELSNLLAAIGYIQRQNDYGRYIKIHGLNISLGYRFDEKWFAAGQSPLCVEVDRLVRSGVCVVVAAGNGGYGWVTTELLKNEKSAHIGTISDPGNAALAITVGSTHRDMPHSYGVSYFSGKGPTADGRLKPDLVAPGERIVSCAAAKDESSRQADKANKLARFRTDSGTSMAAPHVSGVIAAFLSVREEFKGKPEQVKDILLGSATDLKRRPEFQGAGLVDIMRALQSI